MKLLVFVAATQMGLAQPPAEVTKLLTRGAAVLDSARHAKGVRIPVVDNADVIYAAALNQLSQGNYTGAQRMAEVAIRLAHGAQHGPLEIGARIDSLPFGVIPAPAGVPQSALSSY